jgi:hypothetical protein
MGTSPAIVNIVEVRVKPTEKQVWEPMRLTDVGHVGQVVEGGGGKLSMVTHDEGDNRKPPGLG